MSSKYDGAILNNVLLIAGDQTETGQLFKNLQQAYNVFVCSNMEEVQQVLDKISIPLIICDVNNTPGSNGEMGFMKKLNDLIAGHLHNRSLNVDMLASLVNMSRPTLYRKIKNITDLTPNELINLARLRRAAELLGSGNYKVYEIAGMVGFHSQSSFGKAFIKQFKVTPTQYLRMNRNDRLQNRSRIPQKQLLHVWAP
jgi:AraC-like DNA-binding protein